MKRLIPTAILLILLVLICFLGNRRVIKMCGEINEKITECYEAYEIGEYSLAAKTASDIHKHWQEKEKRLAFFC